MSINAETRKWSICAGCTRHRQRRIVRTRKRRTGTKLSLESRRRPEGSLFPDNKASAIGGSAPPLRGEKGGLARSERERTHSYRGKLYLGIVKTIVSPFGRKKRSRLEYFQSATKHIPIRKRRWRMVDGGWRLSRE